MTKTKRYTFITLSVVFISVLCLGVYFEFKLTREQNTQADAVADSVPTFIIAFEGEVVSLDPIKFKDVFGLRVGSQIFEGLSKVDADNRIVPAVASGWEPDDGFQKWTFTLRDNLSFHNGQPVTLEDVVFSYKRMLTKDAVTKGPLADILAGAKAYSDGQTEELRGIQMIPPNQIRFHLTRPDAEFPGRIASPTFGIIPSQSTAQSVDASGHEVTIGSGPFQLIKRDGNDIILKRFTGYRGGSANNFDNLVFRTIKEDQVRLNAMRNGTIQAMYVTPPLVDALLEPGNEQDNTRLKSEFSAFKAISYPVFNTYFLAFNYPKVDLNLRRAISLAIDRKQIAQGVASHVAVPAAGPIPLSCDGWQSQVPVQPPSLEDAEKLLKKYRKANPKTPPKIEILVHDLAQAVPIGEIVQAQLAPLGIEVVLRRLSFNTVIDQLTKGDFQAVAIAFEYQYPTPSLILENFYTSRVIPMPNLFHYSEPEIDTAVEKLFVQASGSETLRDAEKIEKCIVEDAPAVFLFQASQIVIMTNKIDGVRFNSANFPIFERASWN